MSSRYWIPSSPEDDVLYMTSDIHFLWTLNGVHNEQDEDEGSRPDYPIPHLEPRDVL